MMNDEDLVDKYLLGKEFLGRSKGSEDEATSCLDGDPLADESLLVSPILADYIRGSNVDNVPTTSEKSRASRLMLEDPADEDEGRKNVAPVGGASTGGVASPERINLGSELQLDTSYCPSLGLGSDDNSSVESGESKNFDLQNSKSTTPALEQGAEDGAGASVLERGRGEKRNILKGKGGGDERAAESSSAMSAAAELVSGVDGSSRDMLRDHADGADTRIDYAASHAATKDFLRTNEGDYVKTDDATKCPDENRDESKAENSNDGLAKHRKQNQNSISLVHQHGSAEKVSPCAQTPVARVLPDSAAVLSEESGRLSDDSEECSDPDISFHIGRRSSGDGNDLISPIAKEADCGGYSDDDTIRCEAVVDVNGHQRLKKLQGDDLGEEKGTISVIASTVLRSGEDCSFTAGGGKNRSYDSNTSASLVVLGEDGLTRVPTAEDEMENNLKGLFAASRSQHIFANVANSTEKGVNQTPSKDRSENKQGVPVDEVFSPKISFSSPACSRKKSSPTYESGQLDTTYTSERTVAPPRESNAGGNLMASPSDRYGDGTFSQGPSHSCRDLSSARKKVNAQSSALAERLRGAAQRRRLLVTRSRDSLAAKEQMQLMSVASKEPHSPSPPLDFAPDTESRGATLSGSTRTPKVQRDGIDPYKPFKARPLPVTTGEFGSGGQVGVPKVPKRPTTTPFSPKLGPCRRKADRSSVANEQPKASASVNRTRNHGMAKKDSSISKAPSKHLRKGPPEENPFVPFKARPLPATTDERGHGGQLGVPKVVKRQVTVPSSPCLGAKRKNGDKRHSPSASPAISSQKNLASRISEPTPSRESIRPPPKHRTVVKKTALNAQPFERVLAGSEASRAKDAAMRERIQREEVEAQKQAEFHARPLPVSTVSANCSSSPGLLGLELLNERSRRHSQSFGTNEGENIAPLLNASPLFRTEQVSPSKKQRSSLPPSLKSTSRAKSRAEFAKLRDAQQREKRTQQEKRRQSIVEEKRAELELLREHMR